MKKVWRGFAAAVSAAAIAATGFIGATSANADEATVTPTPGAITIKNPIEGDQFKAYQLLGVTIDDSAYAYKLLGADNAAKIDNPATKALVNAINSANATAELDLDTDTDGKQTTISIPTQRDDNTVNTFEQKLVKAISIFTGDSNMRLFAQELAKQVATQNVPVAGEATADENTGNALVIKGERNAALPIGYYLVDHVDQANTGNRTLSTHLVNTLTAAGAVLDLKTATVEFEKKVEDWNESLGDKKKNSGTIDSDAWQDSADHKLRDEVPFMLKGSLPSNYANYDVFQYQFSDTLSEGLTLKKDSINVQLVNFGTPNVVVKNLTADEFQVVPDANNNTDNAGLPVGATKFTVKVGTEKTQGTGENAVTIRDLKGVTSTKNSEGKIVDIPNFSVANTKIVVTYKATVNKKAVIGTTGNPNKANLSISENPDNGWDGLISTPEDIVIVFTYKYTVNKTFDGQTTNVPAQLPSFLLEKFIPAKNGKVTINNVKGNWDAVGEKVQVKNVAEDGKTPVYQASFSHLDDGYYKLSEKDVPAGYNPAADKFFTVTAEHDAESDNPQLKKLTVTYYTDATFTPRATTADGKDDVVVNTPTTEGDGDAAVTTPASGSVVVTIDNKSGSELPSTGGMGTTILYAAGAAIVLIAGIGLAVALRRRQA
ncbi:isopeptide-forming domain-containing fimbrial protein [Bifidobacterium pseudolongum]|uniref:isopeptide-forming domain-containing fimbrial protein n=1 Tax=Bifidobacterium pseudolongum TaxID=1694 RepID=UPI0022E3E860|nr:isopeptide-forming domain-containing fimbrial protein [Bifidobacterium pseudolongum]